ncbi:hypothetical protein GE09DRAFT_1152566 [Coniochaeta sp. 2T2.1]|nr:hypothetical protein GE09DRAFT_1152566 [Coniochaeta sp. 2T2.1]
MQGLHWGWLTDRLPFVLVANVWLLSQGLRAKQASSLLGTPASEGERSRLSCPLLPRLRDVWRSATNNAPCRMRTFPPNPLSTLLLCLQIVKEWSVKWSLLRKIRYLKD